MSGIVIRSASEDEYDAVARMWKASHDSTGLATGSDATLEDLRERIPVEIAKG